MKSNWNGLTQPEKEAYATLCDYFRSYCSEPNSTDDTKCHFEQSEMQHVEPGKKLIFNEPPKIYWEPKQTIESKALRMAFNSAYGLTGYLHWEPKVLGKVKSREECIDGFRCDIKLYSTMGSEKWIKDLQDYLCKEANRRRQVWNYVDDVPERNDGIDALRYYVIANGFNPDTYKKTDASANSVIAKNICDALINTYLDSFTEGLKRFEKLNDILRNAFRTAQEREIAKYSVKSKEELSVPYDIWEQNKIKKGEFEMNDSVIKYNEMKANARKAYDEAMAIAEKEKKAAETEEVANEAAGVLKTMYDAYLNAGFSAEQAEKFVTIQLEKLMLIK